MKRFKSILCASLVTMATASSAFAGNITTLANGNITTLPAGNITTLITDHLYVVLSLLG